MAVAEPQFSYVGGSSQADLLYLGFVIKSAYSNSILAGDIALLALSQAQPFLHYIHGWYSKDAMKYVSDIFARDMSIW